MPRVAPPGGAVDWPETEGTLGVVGVAPWATLEFCRVLYEQVRATKDWHFPRLIVDINTKIPSRGRHLQLGETDPSSAIAATIAELAAQGATLAVVVCNTAHILHDRWSREAPIPILHIIEETIRAAIARGATQVVPLVSASLAKYDLYGQQASALGLGCARLGPTDQSIVNDLIESIKVSGAIGDAMAPTVQGLLDRIRSQGVDTVIAGCTELSLLDDLCGRVGLQLVDSNASLARAALNRLGLPNGLIGLARP